MTDGIAANVLGIADGGEIEAGSFDFAPRRAKTNFYELNLKIKNEQNSFLAEIEAQTLNLVPLPRFWQYLVSGRLYIFLDMLKFHFVIQQT